MSRLIQTYLQTGSNQGQHEEQLKRAKDLIEERIGSVSLSSSLYETAAWGNTQQPHFLNQVLAVETTLEPEQLLKTVLKIEEEMGRHRKEKWEPRIIDIDILLYGEQIIDTDSLTIPHPHLHERNFVLIPLMEIAGNQMHPVLEKTIEDLYLESTDPLEVILLDDHNE